MSKKYEIYKVKYEEALSQIRGFFPKNNLNLYKIESTEDYDGVTICVTPNSDNQAEIIIFAFFDSFHYSNLDFRLSIKQCELDDVIGVEQVLLIIQSIIQGNVKSYVWKNFEVVEIICDSKVYHLYEDTPIKCWLHKHNLKYKFTSPESITQYLPWN